MIKKPAAARAVLKKEIHREKLFQGEFEVNFVK
jgi:hypothetical protein